MTTTNSHIIITFPSVHHALKFEAKLKFCSLDFELVPVPREISSSCGIAAKVQKENAAEFLSYVMKESLIFDQIYLYETNSKILKNISKDI